MVNMKEAASVTALKNFSRQQLNMLSKQKNDNVLQEDKRSPRSEKLIESVYPILKHYGYKNDDICEFVSSYKFDIETIQQELCNIVESKERNNDDLWKIVKSKKNKKTNEKGNKKSPTVSKSSVLHRTYTSVNKKGVEHFTQAGGGGTDRQQYMSNDQEGSKVASFKHMPFKGSSFKENSFKENLFKNQSLKNMTNKNAFLRGDGHYSKDTVVGKSSSVINNVSSTQSMKPLGITTTAPATTTSVTVNVANLTKTKIDNGISTTSAVGTNGLTETHDVSKEINKLEKKKVHNTESEVVGKIASVNQEFESVAKEVGIGDVKTQSEDVKTQKSKNKKKKEKKKAENSVDAAEEKEEVHGEDEKKHGTTKKKNRKSDEKKKKTLGEDDAEDKIDMGTVRHKGKEKRSEESIINELEKGPSNKMEKANAHAEKKESENKKSEELAKVNYQRKGVNGMDTFNSYVGNYNRYNNTSVYNNNAYGDKFGKNVLNTSNANSSNNNSANKYTVYKNFNENAALRNANKRFNPLNGRNTFYNATNNVYTKGHKKRYVSKKNFRRKRTFSKNSMDEEYHPYTGEKLNYDLVGKEVAKSESIVEESSEEEEVNNPSSYAAIVNSGLRGAEEKARINRAKAIGDTSDDPPLKLAYEEEQNVQANDNHKDKFVGDTFKGKQDEKMLWVNILKNDHNANANVHEKKGNKKNSQVPAKKKEQGEDAKETHKAEKMAVKDDTIGKQKGNKTTNAQGQEVDKNATKMNAQKKDTKKEAITDSDIMKSSKEVQKMKYVAKELKTQTENKEERKEEKAEQKEQGGKVKVEENEELNEEDDEEEIDEEEGQEEEKEEEDEEEIEEQDNNDEIEEDGVEEDEDDDEIEEEDEDEDEEEEDDEEEEKEAYEESETEENEEQREEALEEEEDEEKAGEKQNLQLKKLREKNSTMLDKIKKKKQGMKKKIAKKKEVSKITVTSFVKEEEKKMEEIENKNNISIYMPHISILPNFNKKIFFGNLHISGENLENMSTYEIDKQTRDIVKTQNKGRNEVNENARPIDIKDVNTHHMEPGTDITKNQAFITESRNKMKSEYMDAGVGSVNKNDTCVGRDIHKNYENNRNYESSINDVQNIKDMKHREYISSHNNNINNNNNNNNTNTNNNHKREERELYNENRNKSIYVPNSSANNNSNSNSSVGVGRSTQQIHAKAQNISYSKVSVTPVNHAQLNSPMRNNQPNQFSSNYQTSHNVNTKQYLNNSASSVLNQTTVGNNAGILINGKTKYGHNNNGNNGNSYNNMKNKHYDAEMEDTNCSPLTHISQKLLQLHTQAPTSNNIASANGNTNSGNNNVVTAGVNMANNTAKTNINKHTSANANTTSNSDVSNLNVFGLNASNANGSHMYNLVAPPGLGTQQYGYYHNMSYGYNNMGFTSYGTQPMVSPQFTTFHNQFNKSSNIPNNNYNYVNFDSFDENNLYAHSNSNSNNMNSMNNNNTTNTASVNGASTNNVSGTNANNNNTTTNNHNTTSNTNIPMNNFGNYVSMNLKKNQLNAEDDNMSNSGEVSITGALQPLNLRQENVINANKNIINLGACMDNGNASMNNTNHSNTNNGTANVSGVGNTNNNNATSAINANLLSSMTNLANNDVNANAQFSYLDMKKKQINKNTNEMHVPMGMQGPANAGTNYGNTNSSNNNAVGNANTSNTTANKNSLSSTAYNTASNVHHAQNRHETNHSLTNKKHQQNLTTSALNQYAQNQIQPNHSQNNSSSAASSVNGKMDTSNINGHTHSPHQTAYALSKHMYHASSSNNHNGYNLTQEKERTGAYMNTTVNTTSANTSGGINYRNSWNGINEKNISHYNTNFSGYRAGKNYSYNNMSYNNNNGYSAARDNSSNYFNYNYNGYLQGQTAPPGLPNSYFGNPPYQQQNNYNNRNFNYTTYSNNVSPGIWNPEE